MENKGTPLKTHFRVIGGSIFMKLDPHAVDHLELNYLKKQDTDNRTTGKHMREINEKEEKYISAWNPNAESQTQDDNQ